MECATGTFHDAAASCGQRQEYGNSTVLLFFIVHGQSSRQKSLVFWEGTPALWNVPQARSMTLRLRVCHVGAKFALLRRSFLQKNVIRPLPCSSFPNRTRCAGLRFGGGEGRTRVLRARDRKQEYGDFSILLLFCCAYKFPRSALCKFQMIFYKKSYHCSRICVMIGKIK